MIYKFFNNSQKAWKAIYEEISTAEKSVYIEMYIFQNDMIDFNFIKLLKEKSINGIKVRIILDSFGSYSLEKQVILDLKNAEVEIFFISHFLHRTHRKIVIVDEKVAFIGGVNFHQSAMLWKDLVVKIKGTLVSSIIKSFAKIYSECGGKDTEILGFLDNNIIKNKIHTWLVEHSPIRSNFYLKQVYKKYIGESNQKIVLVTPYLMPKRWLIGLLHQAVLRGVTVDILVPRKSDSYFIDRVNYFFILKLSKLNVNIYMEPEMNHAKAMIIDSKNAIIGSQNLDYLSFELNSEIGVFFKDKIAVMHLSKIVEDWKKSSQLFKKSEYKLNIFDYILHIIISLFYKIL